MILNLAYLNKIGIISMNDNIDWHNFLDSSVCLRGMISFDTENNQPIFRENGIILFDTSIPSIDKLNKLLSNGTQGQRGNTRDMWPSLYITLTLLPDNLKKNIVTQWISTLQVIEQLSVKSSLSFLVIGRPGKYLPKHRHGNLTKQTLTFQFEFPNYTEATTYNLDNSYIRLYDANDCATHELVTGKTNVTAFTIMNNTKHDANFKNLKFCWIYDFDNYLDLDKVDLGDFEFLEFKPVKNE